MKWLLLWPFQIIFIHKIFFNMRTWQTCAKIKKHRIIFTRSFFVTIVEIRGRKIITQQANREFSVKNIRSTLREASFSNLNRLTVKWIKIFNLNSQIQLRKIKLFKTKKSRIIKSKSWMPSAIFKQIKMELQVSFKVYSLMKASRRLLREINKKTLMYFKMFENWTNKFSFRTQMKLNKSN